MNQKRIAGLALIASLFALAAPANAATVNKTITVKWNTQATATLNVHTNYAASGLSNSPGTAGSILAHGAGACTAADPTNSDGTNDFGQVSPDGGGGMQDCLYKNAANAIVATNSTNWNLTAATATNPTTLGAELCALANGVANFPFSAAALPVTQTVRAAALSSASTASCVSGSVLNNTALTLANETNAFTGASPANIGFDLDLVLGPTANTGNQSEVVTFTLTAN